MKVHDKLLLPLLGLAIWIGGTVWFEARGPRVLESTALRYWINFIVTPVGSAALCVLILKWRQVSASDWAAAALLLALPGMFGEALLLSRFAVFMPRMHPESAGRYGALLFASYALFLTLSEIVTLSANSAAAVR
jgi:hypothetical protein